MDEIDDFPYDYSQGDIDLGSGGVPDPEGGFLPVQFGGLGGLLRGGATGGAAAAGRAVLGGVRRAGTIITAAGRRISTTKAYQLMRQWGPEIAAAALGMSIGDLIAILADSGAMTRRRRRRGISSRDIRTASRVVRFVNRMQNQLGCVTRARRRYPDTHASHHRRA